MTYVQVDKHFSKSGTTLLGVRGQNLFASEKIFFSCTLTFGIVRVYKIVKPLLLPQNDYESIADWKVTKNYIQMPLATRQ